MTTVSARFGMDYGGTNVKAGVFHQDGTVLHFREKPLSELASRGALLEDLLAFAREVSHGYSLQAGGFAIKGLVDGTRGVVQEDIGAGSLLAGVNLRAAFSRALGVPFVLENDARAYAWGEWLFGAGRGAKVMVCMTLGTGIGCAVVADGRPYRGAGQTGGLLGGHLSIDRNGPLCPCGHRGCLELYCSASALHRLLLERHPELGRGKEDVLAAFFRHVRENNKSYEASFTEFIDNLALGVVNVVHAYGPDVVVLGGGVMRSADVILPPLIERVHRMAWTYPRGSVEIRAAQLDNRAAAQGVAFFPPPSEE
jgi:glucokinase